ncbi:MAG: LytR/AlgR family response regulator transcription factor [Bacteroidales bacterium]
MDKIKYVIIDDEKSAHTALIDLMKIHEGFECIGGYYDVIEAIPNINKLNPDFIFLDVEMPNVNGFELLNYIDKSIEVIITSSHRDYAYTGYENNVFHFLSKPIFQDKLFKVIYRLTEIYKNNEKGSIKVSQFGDNANKYLYVSKLRDNTLLRIQIKDICSLEKLHNSLEIRNDKGKYFYREDNICSIIKELPSNYFKIINRSTIINLAKAIWIDEKTVSVKNGKIFKVSSNFK